MPLAEKTVEQEVHSAIADLAAAISHLGASRMALFRAYGDKDARYLALCEVYSAAWDAWSFLMQA